MAEEPSMLKDVQRSFAQIHRFLRANKKTSPLVKLETVYTTAHTLYAFFRTHKLQDDEEIRENYNDLVSKLNKLNHFKVKEVKQAQLETEIDCCYDLIEVVVRRIKLKIVSDNNED